MLPYSVPYQDFAFEHAIMGMAIVSMEGEVLQVNAALCELLGCSKQEVMDGTFRALNDGGILEVIRQKAADGRLEPSPMTALHVDVKYEHPEGRNLHLKLHFSASAEAPAPIRHCLVQFEDLTPVYELEEQLVQKEMKLSEREDGFLELLEELPLSAFITKNGIVQYVNQATLRLLHASDAADVIGISTDVVVDPSSHHKLARRRTRYAKYREIGPVTYLINCFDGQQKIVSGFTLITTYQGEKAALSIFKDITEQKMEEDRIMQSEKLTTAGQLAAGIAHEIRNPLTSINGFIKLLRTSEKSNKLYFDIIESELKRIELIVNELLVLSKPEIAHVSKPLDVLDIIEQIVTLMKVQAAMNNIEIIPRYPAEPVYVHGETNQLKQVFINLLKNAMEAMDQGGTITLSIHQSDSDVRIIVQDDGIGMTPEQIKSLGQPFYTTKDSGTGLGYMITKNIVHNHGGSIDVKSSPERGTSFTIQLPVL
ncbi:ATP-binding protein [Paenibacillus ihbetae]|uniref:histidine kinase n=1 Tax=Paenibacillus ihbetae TaxID=1870820 RepID=A0A1B2E7M9_9BACL|nr:ATP-binding protein [Paenibacillus ihbetae]ANY75978.1 PAS domain-containing sensor histidine kinase [Paenibacillus ihbetae]OOC61867.1 PAS domain-containing sensor histidine kinase [Paenibacillus ihbetae]